MKKFIWVFGLIFALTLVQFYLLPNFNVFGVRPNFVLAGLVVLASLGWGPLLLGGVLAGCLFSLVGLEWSLTLLIFPIVVLIIYFLEKKFLFKNRLLSIFMLAVLATILFNFLYILFNNLFSVGYFQSYFFSFFHLVEIVLNGILVLILSRLFKKIKKSII